MPADRFQLTISIPTFNRPELVLQQVGSLLPQLTSNVFLRVIDNCSTTDVADSIRKRIPDQQLQQVEIIRNRQNIGGSANILRCLELCQTEWLWILGDDDTILPDAVKSALDAIAGNPESLAINFSSPSYSQSEYSNTHGVSEYLSRVGSFSASLFTSTVLYRASAMQDNLRFGYHFAFSMAPNLAILLITLGPDGMVSFSARSLLAEHRSAPASDTWSPIVLAAGKGALLDLPIDRDARKQLGAMMTFKPALEALALHQWLFIIRGGDMAYALHMFDQAYFRLYAQFPGIFMRTRWVTYRTLFRYPRLGVGISRVVFRLIRRISPYNIARVEDLKVTDLFSRL